jgi:hypothetical protein
MMSALIQTSQTPNPNALKFILPEKRFAQAQNFSSPQAAAAHPLAARLFALGGIYNVLLAQDFVTVNKLPAVAWRELTEPIKAAIAEFLVEG